MKKKKKYTEVAISYSRQDLSKANRYHCSSDQEIEDTVSKWIPTFIYMDDHKPFQGTAHLDQINQRRNDNQLTDEDKTFLMILKMAELDFDDGVAACN